MANELFEMADKIIEGQKKIKETEAEKLILNRLLEREAICRELIPNYGKYGDPLPSVKRNHFSVYDINVHENYSVEFNWSEYWTGGGRDEGHMTLTKEEFLAGDFTELKKQLTKK